MHSLVHAFIASRVDYCNALLYGVALSLTESSYMQPRGLSPASDAPSTSHRHSSLAADIIAHHLQNCADDVRLYCGI